MPDDTLMPQVYSLSLNPLTALLASMYTYSAVTSSYTCFLCIHIVLSVRERTATSSGASIPSTRNRRTRQASIEIIVLFISTSIFSFILSLLLMIIINVISIAYYLDRRITHLLKKANILLQPMLHQYPQTRSVCVCHVWFAGAFSRAQHKHSLHRRA